MALTRISRRQTPTSMNSLQALNQQEECEDLQSDGSPLMKWFSTKCCILLALAPFGSTMGCTMKFLLDNTPLELMPMMNGMQLAAPVRFQ
jgi:hypothetical protein